MRHSFFEINEWETNVMDHGRWTMDDMEIANMGQLSTQYSIYEMQQGSPRKKLHQPDNKTNVLCCQAFAGNTRSYTHYREHAGLNSMGTRQKSHAHFS